MKGGQTMKAMRYLLSVIVIVSAITLQAQDLVHYPMAQMHSTSVMAASGSSLPQAAVTGAYTTSDAPSSGPRRAKFDENPFGGQTINDVQNPSQPGTPLPDGTWALLLFAALFTLWKARKTIRPVGEQ